MDDATAAGVLRMDLDPGDSALFGQQAGQVGETAGCEVVRRRANQRQSRITLGSVGELVRYDILRQWIEFQRRQRIAAQLHLAGWRREVTIGEWHVALRRNCQ